jgi:hemerythrin-like domain-containing protein
VESHLDLASVIRSWSDYGETGSRPQRPEEELWAEHLLMRSIVAALKKEARALRDGDPLRADFWNGIVDFIGNFVHSVHRAKEEAVFCPELIEHGLMDQDAEANLHREHGQLKDLTLELCAGVEEGDWEKALRVVARYAGLVSKHLDDEERHLRDPVVRDLPDDEVEAIRIKFDAIEDRVLASTGRAHYLALTKSLCADVGILPLFEGG